MSHLASDIIDFVVGILLIITIVAGSILFIAGWTDEWIYLKGIGIILTTGLTAVTLATIKPKGN